MQYLFLPNKGSYYLIKEIKCFKRKLLGLFSVFISLQNQSSHERLSLNLQTRWVIITYDFVAMLFQLNSSHLCKKINIFVKYIVYIQDIKQS